MGPTSPDVRKSLWISPPRAYGAAGPCGQPIVVATTNGGTGYIELDTTVFGQAYSMGTSMLVAGLGAPSGSPQGLMGVCIDVFADAADIGVVFGSTAALVSGSGVVPSLTAAGTISGGVYTAAAQVCMRIASGTYRRYFTQVGVDKYIGWVGAGTGYIRIVQSSPVGLDG